MGWSIGYDPTWGRDIGYGVPAFCDHPQCRAEIDRGLAHVCGGEPYGGDYGCGLYFCGEHHRGSRGEGHDLCPRCTAYKAPYKRIKPEHPRWIEHKLSDPSWADWRTANPVAAAQMRARREYESDPLRVAGAGSWDQLPEYMRAIWRAHVTDNLPRR